MKLSKIKIIILILAILLYCVFPVNQANAGMWGEDMLAMITGISLQQILDAIKAALLGAAKQAAVKMIDSQVDNLIGGSGSGNAKFVTNWQDYLYKQPAEKAKLYMNDWFDSVSGGKSSSSNYSSASSSGDYMGQLVKQTKSSLLNDQTPTANIQEYAKDPTQPFAEGNWRAFNALISNPVNNAFGLALAAQQEYLSKLEAEQKKAETQAVAYQGYLATTSGGGSSSGLSVSKEEPTVTAPGSLTASIEANTKNMGNQAITSAQSIPEVIISALVNKLLTKVLNQGIGNAQQNTQRQNNSTNDNSSSNNNSNSNSSSGFGSFLFGNQ